MQTLVLRATPDIDDAEVVITGCPTGRKTRTVLIPRHGLMTVARQIMGRRERLAEQRQLERERPHSILGWSGTTCSFGNTGGHFRATLIGPGAVELPPGLRDVPVEEARGCILVEFWTGRERVPALSELLDERGAQALTNVLWEGSQPPGRIEFTWAAAAPARWEVTGR